MIPDNLLDMEEVLDGGIALQDLRRAIMGNHEENYYGTPPEEYEYLPPPDDYDYVQPEINKTKKARHAKYGIGVVTSETEDMITVLFDGYGEKTFLKAFGEIILI